MTPKFKLVQRSEAFNSETSEYIAQCYEPNGDRKYLFESKPSAFYTYTVDAQSDWEITPADPAEICEILGAIGMTNSPLYPKMFARIPEFGSESKRIVTTLSAHLYKLVEVGRLNVK